MPFVKCLSGFAEVPYQVPPWSLPVAPRMPKNKPKEAYLVPAPKARLYPIRFLLRSASHGVQRDRTRDSPFPSPRKRFKNVPGTRLEGTFECKARLENADPGRFLRHPVIALAGSFGGIRFGMQMRLFNHFKSFILNDFMHSAVLELGKTWPHTGKENTGTLK